MNIRTVRVALFATVWLVTTGCHRHTLGRMPSPVAEESPCWWSVFRTPLPVDTVTVHLVNAFTTLGLTGATLEQHGDTAWAHAGPTRLDDWGGGTYSARMAAFRRGDSTLYRYFVAVVPPPGGWRPSYDSVTADGRHISVNPAGAVIGFCHAIASTSQNHGTAPNAPNGEESLAVWGSRHGAPR